MSAPEVRLTESFNQAPPSVQLDVAMTVDGSTDVDVDAALGLFEDANGAVASSVTERPHFIEYLSSPIVEVAVGLGQDPPILSAHSALLEHSPYLATKLASFATDAPHPRRVALADADLAAVGAFLEFLYTGEYTPRLQGDQLEGAGALDDGAELLRHAHIYTLAQQLGLQALQALAHSKVHRVHSSAQGEIAYARYVYEHTPPEDTVIRRLIASFWARRSHVLRREADKEFRALCLELPQFGFDVLSQVLDQRERKELKNDHSREGTLAESETPRSTRKRTRQA